MANNRYEINSLVSGSIIRLEPHRIIVSLDEGGTAILREQETAWSESESQRWKGHAKVGQKINAKVIRYDGYGRTELSLRMASRDPWDSINARYKVGDLVSGVIKGHTSDALFVAIEPGVEGILRREETGIFRSAEISENFWPGDSVFGIIQTLSSQDRRLSLTLDGVRERRWKQNLTLRPDYSTSSAILRKEMILQDDLESLSYDDFGQKYWILIVDNDDNERHELAQCLKRAKQDVIEARNLEEAKQHLFEHSVLLNRIQQEIVFLDRQMPGGNGDNALPQLQLLYPQIRFVLMSHSLYEREQDDWARRDVPALSKPLSRKAIIEAIKPSVPNENDRPRISEAASHASISPSAKLGNWLSRIKAHTQAAQVILFALHPTGEDIERVEIYAQKPDSYLNIAAVERVVYSPVRDVARLKKTFICKDVYDPRNHVGYLRNLIQFEACVGVPVSVNSIDKYVLFVFWDSPLALSDKDFPCMLENLFVSGAALGSIIEQILLLQIVEDNQKSIIAGELSQARAHDMRDRIGVPANEIKDLVEGLGRCQALSLEEGGKVKEELRFWHEKATFIKSKLNDAVKIFDLFKGLSIRDTRQYTLITGVVEQAVALAANGEQYDKVRIEYVRPDKMIVAKASQHHLMQMLQNIILNAAQQLVLFNPPDDWRVRVSIRLGTSVDSAEIIQIRIEDNGPGIHFARFESIFELGNTSRTNKGGSGIGLYVSRSLANHLGGRVLVESSAIGWGSCFLIEVPCIY